MCTTLYGRAMNLFWEAMDWNADPRYFHGLLINSDKPSMCKSAEAICDTTRYGTDEQDHVHLLIRQHNRIEGTWIKSTSMG